MERWMDGWLGDFRLLSYIHANKAVLDWIDSFSLMWLSHVVSSYHYIFALPCFQFTISVNVVTLGINKFTESLKWCFQKFSVEADFSAIQLSENLTQSASYSGVPAFSRTFSHISLSSSDQMEFAQMPSCDRSVNL